MNKFVRIFKEFVTEITVVDWFIQEFWIMIYDVLIVFLNFAVSKSFNFIIFFNAP